MREICMVKTFRHPYCVYLAVSFGHWSSGHRPRSATGLSVANQHEIEFGACFWYNPDAGRSAWSGSSRQKLGRQQTSVTDNLPLDVVIMMESNMMLQDYSKRISALSCRFNKFGCKCIKDLFKNKLLVHVLLRNAKKTLFSL